MFQGSARVPGCSMPTVTDSQSARALRVLVYSDDAQTRAQVIGAIGTRPDPGIPPVSYIEVATAPMVFAQLDAGVVDAVIADGEATPAGGMGLAKQMKDELDPCPPVLVLLGRADEGGGTAGRACLGGDRRVEALVEPRSRRRQLAHRDLLVGLVDAEGDVGRGTHLERDTFGRQALQQPRVLGGAHADAEDVVQDAFIRALRGLRAGAPVPCRALRRRCRAGARARGATGGG